jgi:simple sugar transport system ATP-binding protein
MVNQRNEGMGVLIVSSELDEVLALGDRIAVMHQGRITGVVDPSTSRETIGLMMAGATAGAAHV